MALQFSGQSIDAQILTYLDWIALDSGQLCRNVADNRVTNDDAKLGETGLAGTAS